MPTAQGAARPSKRQRPDAAEPRTRKAASRVAGAARPLPAPTPVPAPAPAAPLLPPFRLEYGATGPLPSVELLTSLRRRGLLRGVHVANKDAGDRLLERGRELAAALAAASAAAAAAAASASPPAPGTPPPPPVEVCLHYSLKLNGRGDEAVKRLARFLREAAWTVPGCSVLLVSGGGDPARRPKGQLCSAEALERLALALQAGEGVLEREEEEEGGGASKEEKNDKGGERAAAAAAAAGAATAAVLPQPPLLPPLYVAFNPYFPDSRERERERERLRRKLATGLVTGGVALQFGADAALLREGLSFLRSGALGGNDSAAAILGSVFVPDKRFLASMRFRPWRGVFLPQDGFLDSVEAAERATARLLRVYCGGGEGAAAPLPPVTPLVEAPAVADEASLLRAEALLARGMVPED